MFCIHCGSQLREDALFCSACGAPVGDDGALEGQGAGRSGAPGAPVAQAAPGAQDARDGGGAGAPVDGGDVQAGFAGQMESARAQSRKKLSPLMIVVLVLALLAAAVLAVVLVTQQAGQGEGAAEMAQGPEAEPEQEPQLTEEERVIKSLDGWWQRGARQWLYDGYVYFHDGQRDRFTADGQYDGSLPEITPDQVHRHAAGLQGATGTAFIDVPGYFIDVNSGDLGFYLTDDAPDSLSWLKEDGTGYSGGETFGRVDPPEWASEAIAALGAAQDGSASLLDASSASQPAFDQAAAEAEARAAAEAAGKTVLTGTVFVGKEADWAEVEGLQRASNPGSGFTYVGLILDEPATVSARNADGGTVDEKPYVECSGEYVLLGSDFRGNEVSLWSPYDGQRVSVAFSDFSSFSDSLGVLFAFSGKGERIAPLTEADVATVSAAVPDGDYVLADSDTRRYSRAELEAMDLHTLFLARNEVFARHGCGFQNQELRDWFGSKPWYSEQIPAGTYGTELLDDTERANVELMRDIEIERDSPYIK